MIKKLLDFTTFIVEVIIVALFILSFILMMNLKIVQSVVTISIAFIIGYTFAAIVNKY